MEEPIEEINHAQRRRAMVLDAEGAMVDLLHRKQAFRSSEIPAGYQKQLADWFECGLIPFVISRETFHLFYNWLREVGRDEPEL